MTATSGVSRSGEDDGDFRGSASLGRMHIRRGGTIYHVHTKIL